MQQQNRAHTTRVENSVAVQTPSRSAGRQGSPRKEFIFQKAKRRSGDAAKRIGGRLRGDDDDGPAGDNGAGAADAIIASGQAVVSPGFELEPGGELAENVEFEFDFDGVYAGFEHDLVVVQVDVLGDKDGNVKN